MRAHFLALSALVMLGACVGTTTSQFSNITFNQAPFQTMINDARSTATASPVAPNAQLRQAAQGHANDMSANNYFSHTSLDGSSFGDRINATGYSYCWGGENIAMGYPDTTSVFNGWMGSSGHRDNMLASQPTQFGLGHAPSGNYWVLVLARPGC